MTAALVLAGAGVLALVAVGLWRRERRLQARHALEVARVHAGHREVEGLEALWALDPVVPEHERRG